MHVRSIHVVAGAARLLAGAVFGLCDLSFPAHARATTPSRPIGTYADPGPEWNWRRQTRLARPGAAGFRSAAVFQERLYLGTEHDREPWNAGVYVFDGDAWSVSSDFGGGAYLACQAVGTAG